MDRRPTYEDLEKRIKDLETEKRAHENEDAGLKESVKFRTLVERSLAGMYIVQDGSFIYVNPRFAEMLGYGNAGELVGMPFQNNIHPRDKTRIRSKEATVEKAMSLGSRSNFRAVRKDGSFIWVDMRDSHTTYLGKTANVGNVIDITEQKLAEESLRESEERYRNILDTIEDGYYEVDLAGNLTFFNKSVCKILGYPCSDLMGLNYREYTDEENAERTYRIFNRVYTSGEPAKAHDWLTIRKDGSQGYIELSVSLIKDGEGHRTGFRGIVRDITDRKRDEEELSRYRDHLEERVEARTTALRQANTRLEKEIEDRKRIEENLLGEKNFSDDLIRSLPGILYVFDEKRQFLRWNKSFEEVTEYSGDEISRMSALEFFPEEERELVDLRIGDTFTKGKAFVEASLMTKRGKRIPHFFPGLRTTIEGNTYLIGVGIDIAERQRAEEALRKSEKELRMLSSQMIKAQEMERKRVANELHDGLGQSLTAIKYTLENLLHPGSEFNGINSGKSAQSIIPMIQDAVDEVRRISMDLRPSMLDDLGILATISWFCREFMSIYSGTRIEKDVSLDERDIPSELKIVFYRILQEAMNNVAKHSGAETVRLQLKKTENAVVLSVGDDGKGFNPEEVLPVAYSRQRFGLPSMRERTELSGGCFSIKSGEGLGTEVKAEWSFPPG